MLFFDLQELQLQRGVDALGSSVGHACFRDTFLGGAATCLGKLTEAEPLCLRNEVTDTD